MVASSSAICPSSSCMQALMIRYQAGDGDAFDALYRQISPSIRRYLLRLARDASRVDDLVQETFLHIHRARRTYNPGLPLMPWACAIARHVFLMDCRYRRRRAENRHVPLEEDATVPVVPDGERFAERRALTRALGSLPPGARHAVVLHHLHGFTFPEVGRRLHIRGCAARARACRGISELRRRYEALSGSGK